MVGPNYPKMGFPTSLKSMLSGLNTRIITSAAIAITCAVSAAAYYYANRRNEINEVMIFCKLQLNVFNYFDKLISFIEAAQHSVNVCMPSIHNPAIQGRLVELIKKKNIKARIVIDGSGYNSSTASFLKELSEAGAEIKWKISEYRMQHKFCLIDDEVLMTGTLDWGNDLTCDHWNYVYITSKPQLVDPVKREFYQIWNECDTNLTRELVNDIADLDVKLLKINKEENVCDNYEFLEHEIEEISRETPEISIELNNKH